MTGLPLPPVPEPYHLPFHYGALHNIGVDYLIDRARARELLAKRHPGLNVAAFDGGACVSLNYQLYFAQYPNGGGITQELEINLIAHPLFAEERMPVVNYGQYARGYDQTKLLGIARLHVLCDNPLAIDAGRRLYAEPKHPGWFETTLPSLNAPDVRERWTVSCRRAGLGQDGLIRHDEELLALDVNLVGLTPSPSTTRRSPATAPTTRASCWPGRSTSTSPTATTPWTTAPPTASGSTSATLRRSRPATSPT